MVITMSDIESVSTCWVHADLLRSLVDTSTLGSHHPSARLPNWILDIPKAAVP